MKSEIWSNQIMSAFRLAVLVRKMFRVAVSDACATPEKA